MSWLINIICFMCICISAISSLDVSLLNDGPAVRGSKITFTASVVGYAGESLKYVFWDDVQPQHENEFVLSTNESKWTVEYPKELYEAGEYTSKVRLMKSFYGIWYYVASSSTTFKLTDSLNGNLVLNQNNIDRPNTFVAVNKTVLHYIKLPDNEMQFLKENASTIITYWFIDCIYIDMTTDLSLNYTYKDLMSDHYIDALVVANNMPLPPITTTTTTTTITTTTTTTTTNTTTITTTTPKPPTSVLPLQSTTSMPATQKLDETTATTVLPMHKLVKRMISNRTVMKKKNNNTKDYICHNSSIIPIGKTYTYGHYQETISVREPISIVNITGLNWLQHGDLLNLQVKYSGSPPFDYCALYKEGQYNITGNETCNYKSRTVSNAFPLVHYFSDSDQHTVVVVVENDVGKTVSRATINIYKAVVHAQLSVIVVPVVFCLLAVILVVFGIAYYQHRSRYTIEVADFDFGQQAHLDYKTFTERLKDSFRNAFDFRQRDDNDPLTRYDSMS